MTKFHQNYVTLFIAIIFSLLLLPAQLVWQGPGLLPRIGFAAALYLVSRDVLAGAAIAKGPRRISTPNRWIYGYYLALFFGVFMALATWQGTADISKLGGIVIGAALFGLLLGFAFKATDYPYAHHFNTEAAPRFGAWLHMAWPAITLLVVARLACTAVSALDMFYIIILFGFFLPRYPRVINGSALWAYLPRLTGFLILLIIFTLSRLLA